MKTRQANIALDRLNHEIRANEEEVRTVKEKLTDLSAFKEMITCFLDHDLKNALNIVVNADVRSDPVQKLSGIKNTGKRMLYMVHNILGIMGFENGSMTLNTREFRYNEMVLNAFRKVKMQAATSNITISFNQDKNYRLISDPDIAERVLVNLLDNAIRHAPAVSAIEVEAEITDGFLRIVVKDHGEGIPPALLPFIFDKYTHGDQPEQGESPYYGLGLAFCKLAVEAHGGKTGATSEQGTGSEIWFTLPLASGPVMETEDHTRPPLLSSQHEFPKFTEDELTYLREHYCSIKHLSIHQISDIKDLLNKPDENKSVGIKWWKNAVATSVNQYNCQLFSHLIDIITKNG